MEPWVLDRIRAAKAENAISLDLDNAGLREIPEQLVALIGLTSLNLSDNRIGAEGARALSTLTNLTSLNLSDNSIGDEGAHAL